MAYAVAHGGALPARPERIRPVHVADLLSREGHPLAQQLYAARDVIRKQAAVRNPESVASARRALGVAAGAMLVVGTVVASALGLNDTSSAPAASQGEPVGALPGPGSASQPGLGPVQSDPQQDTATSSTDVAPPKAQIVLDAPVAEVPQQLPRQAPPRIGTPASKPPPKAAPAPAPPAQSPLQPVTAPVSQTVGTTTGTLAEVVTPVTDTVDDTLTPALSLIGGLLGR